MVAEQGLGGSLLLCAVLVAAAACGPENQAITQATGGTSGTGGSCQVPPDAGECSISPACGCEAGKNCVVLDQSGATTCVPAGGVKENRGCQAASDCEAGLQCLSFACHRPCTKNEDCAGASPHCDFAPVFPIAGLGFCVTPCNLAKPAEFSVCGPGVNCMVTDSANGITDCRGTGTGNSKGGCPTGNQLECAPGYNCLSGTTDCAKWCRPGQEAADCNAGQTCTTPVVTIAGQGFGFCQ